MRLDRLLVGLGLGSRKEVGQLVRRGRVQVGDALLFDPSAHVDPEARISVDGESVRALPRVVAWHKPVGVQCTMSDPWGRLDLSAVLPERWRAALHPVGRLDADTSGLLLFSSDGQLTQALLHPKRAVPRRYVATVDVDPPGDLPERLADGVLTSLGSFAGEVVAVRGRDVELIVTEGKHRMVRRMLHNAGASVVALHRVAYGPVELGELALGEVREVSDAFVGM